MSGEFYSQDKDTVFEKLDTSEEGLSSEDAERRLEKFGENEIDAGNEIHPLKIFIDQFKDFLIYLLFFAAFISIAIGFFPGHEPEYVDAGLIFLILLANGIFGFVQDYQAEKSIEALRDMSSPEATVLRDGNKKVIDSREVVPGDIVFIEQGDAIPADSRIISTTNLATDESALTGESVQVTKDTEVLESDTPLAERKNMVFMNTSAVTGRGKAVVTDTGMDTEVGDIANQLSEAGDKSTPFQEEVDKLGKKIGYGIILIIIFVAITQLSMTSSGFISVLLVAITLAVAAVPEGLPAVVTLSLAMGSKKMLKKNALVRRLPVVESLGSVDYIVTDKTGTLTEDKMTVRKLYFNHEVYDVTGGATGDGSFEKEGEEVSPESFDELLECGYICNNAEESEDGFIGDPTETALIVSAQKAGLTPEPERVDEIPFSSERKRMTVITEKEGGHRAYMKGATEFVLERCDRYLKDGEVKELDDETRQEILDMNSEFASQALRVLAFASKDIETPEADDDEIESDMVFLGLQGMIDPPREEVKGAVEDCRNAGVSVVMATGDNIETAKAIGEQVGFDPEGAMTGNEIDQLSHEELKEKVEEVEVFARVSPSNKVDILKALQENGHRVGMTGDGVNDAPAIKNSDVGISMGIRGTDVAEQSSDMVLQDDNFVTIRDAIEAGRGIFDNIRKFVNYLLSANAGEVLVVFFGILIGSFFFKDVFNDPATGGALILTPVMLLWINLVTDGLPALALGADPTSPDVMDRPPRTKDEGVISKRMMFSIVMIGILMAVTMLPLFFYNIGTSIVKAQTILFTAMVVFELGRIQIIRRRYHQSIFSNKWLVMALGGSLVLQLLIIYTPVRKLLDLAVLTPIDWLEIIVAFGGFVVLSVGLVKLEDHIFGKDH